MSQKWILLCDKERSKLDRLQTWLHGYLVMRGNKLAGSLYQYGRFKFNLVITDLGSEGQDWLNSLKESRQSVMSSDINPFIRDPERLEERNNHSCVRCANTYELMELVTYRRRSHE